MNHAGGSNQLRVVEGPPEIVQVAFMGVATFKENHEDAALCLP